ncbi:MAG: cell filamentation protein Fic [Thiotrichales bacterium]|nr:MAG: cell filamentation protein Fic [Thiotrichales bacterium]
MDYENFRLTRRLDLPGDVTEQIYMMIASIDGVKNSWRLTDRLLPQTIERLTQSVIITSTGASNRIEGNRLNDIEVENLYRNMHIRKMKTRDEQEVAGYLEVLQLIFESYNDIQMNESSVLHLHKNMLQHSDKDQHHKGKYKFGPNRVEAKDASGNIVGVIFDPTLPHLVGKEMQELMGWYKWASENHYKHPLILIANLVFEYLAIHPFQDGNGRTSRLITNLLLLKNGYDFTKMISHEKIIEANKAQYYLALNKTQKTWKTTKEDISPFLLFFFQTVKTQADAALAIIENDNIESLLSEKQLALWQWITGLGGTEFSRKDAILALGYPSRTTEAIIKKLLDMQRIKKLGSGRATRYVKTQ